METTPSKDDRADRREFLKKILRTAGYSAPVVAVMSMRTIASAQGSASAPHPPPMMTMCGGIPGY